jgi:hypothetical protein
MLREMFALKRGKLKEDGENYTAKAIIISTVSAVCSN